VIVCERRRDGRQGYRIVEAAQLVMAL